MTEYEKCMAGEPFIGSDPQLAAMTIRAKRLLAEFNATDYADTARRLSLLREMLGSVGEGVHVDIDFYCEYGQNYTATHSIPAGCVAVGNPCMVIRQLDGINYKTGRGEMQC